MKKIKIIKDYPNYGVDADGNIYNVKTNVKLCQTYDKDGYKKITLHNKFGIKSFRVHRLIALAFIPNKNNLPLVCHNNSIVNDNRVANLRWDNQSNNLKDRYLVNKDFSGIRNPACKINREIVNRIKEIYKNTKVSQANIGRLFKISQKEVSNIINNKVWSY